MERSIEERKGAEKRIRDKRGESRRINANEMGRGDRKSESKKARQKQNEQE